MTRNYWLNILTEETWGEFLEAGGGASGFLQPRWESAKPIRPGDYLLCYLAGISRFVGVLEVTGDVFKESAPISSAAEFPALAPVRVVYAMQPETAIPLVDLRDQLSVVLDLRNPSPRSGASAGAPALLKQEDGELVLAAIQEALANPVRRALDTKSVAPRPQGLATNNAPVALPEPEEELDEPASSDGEPEAAEAQAHTEVLGTLLQAGTDMGLRVWVARNDRGRLWKGKALGDLPGCLAELPLPNDETTSRAFELTDVLWLHNNAIVAAFEVASTTSIYSGLLRMRDLVAMRPNPSIPLYIVGPEDRPAEVVEQVPTDSRLPTPLVDTCRYIAFPRLQDLLRCIRACETPEARLLAGAGREL